MLYDFVSRNICHVTAYCVFFHTFTYRFFTIPCHACVTTLLVKEMILKTSTGKCSMQILFTTSTKKNQICRHTAYFFIFSILGRKGVMLYSTNLCDWFCRIIAEHTHIDIRRAPNISGNTSLMCQCTSFSEFY